MRYSFIFVFRCSKMLLRNIWKSFNSFIYSCIILLMLGQADIHAQDKKAIQFTGRVFSTQQGRLQVLPYVNVGLMRTGRAVYSNEQGWFSMVVIPGDTVLFQSLGYKPKRHIMNPVWEKESIFANIVLETDTFQLDKAVVFPIPSKEHFKPEFLDMDVSNELEDQAQKNLAAEALQRVASSVPSDGRAAVSLYFSQQATAAVYDGQFKPQNIFNPLAWAEFIKALKRGDFKKKKKKPEE